MTERSFTWANILSRAFWFNKVPDEVDDWIDFHRILMGYGVPKEFNCIMPDPIVSLGFPPPPFSSTSKLTKCEQIWYKAFVNLRKYYERFGRLPSDILVLELFKDALMNVSRYQIK